MRSLPLILALLSALLVCPSSYSQVTPANSPGLSKNPDLEQGYKLLYEQKFSDARLLFEKWVAANPDEPFGQVSIAASYLFEEFYLQRVLTSDYFLNDKRFLGGIEGTPDPNRIKHFDESVVRARDLANKRLKKQPHDPESLFALTLCAGMQS